MEIPRAPSHDPHEFLFYDAPTKGSRPEFWSVPDSGLTGFLFDDGPKGVLVVSYAGLRRILAVPGVDIRFLGDQRVTRKRGKSKTTCLAQTFEPHEDVPCVAVNGAYTGAGRAEQGVRSYVPQSPEGKTRIVAIKDPIYPKMRRTAVRPAVDRAVLRKIRSTYTGVSPEVEEVCRQIALLAPGRETVLILGETGTGKDLIAALLHELSGRPGALVKIDSTNIPEGLAESELFGSVRGAGTNLVNRAGLFEAANRGTVFIDEIGDMEPAIQARLLRVLQNREIVRLGSTTPVRIDVKVIAATHRDLAAMVARGQFRRDLYQRLLVSVISPPPLREHADDVAFHIQRAWRAETGGESFPRHLAKLLLKRDWPGNVRQLDNFLHGLHIQTRGVPLGRSMVEKQLRLFFPGRPDPEPPTSPSPLRRRVPAGPDGALRDAVRSYEVARAAYQDLEQVLRSLVENLVAELCPLAIVRSRTKTATSLAERLQRDWTDNVYRDVRDLCGVRVIVQAEHHKLALLDALERFVEIERGSFPPGHDPQRDAERAPSLCWIRIRRGHVKDLEGRLGTSVPSTCAGHWCELQLRTTTEDVLAAWRETVIGRLDAPPPESWTRSLAEVAEAFEVAQGVFERIRRCATSYGGHLTRDDMRRELAILETTLRCAPNDPTTAARAGKLALNLGEFDHARRIMTPYRHSHYGPLLRDLGVATCQTHEPGSPKYVEGVRLLERACGASPRDPEALAALGGAYLRMGRPGMALRCYREALRIDDSYPYALSGLLALELRDAPSSDLLAAYRPTLKRAVLRCREEIQASVGVPFAHLNLGKFLVLLGKTKDGLEAYVDAIRAATAPFMFQTSIDSLASLLEAKCIPAEMDLARRLLATGLCMRFPASVSAAASATSLPRPGNELRAPTVLLVGRAGSTTPNAPAMLGRVLADGLKGFPGSVVAVGDLDRASSAVEGACVAIDGKSGLVRYRQAEVAAFCTVVPDATPEDIFYPTLAPWADLVAAGVSASSVLLLALGSGSRTARDRHLAHALGARVAVLDVDGDAASNSDADELVIRDARALREVLDRLRGH